MEKLPKRSEKKKRKIMMQENKEKKKREIYLRQRNKYVKKLPKRSEGDEKRAGK